MELERESYQHELGGKKVDLYDLRNKRGMVVKITNWVARVMQILVPDRDGVAGDVALGYDSIDQLQDGQASMGAFVGRYANRIAHARFTLNGREHEPTSGRVMEVWTTEPGIQVYSGNSLEGRRPRDTARAARCTHREPTYASSLRTFPTRPTSPRSRARCSSPANGIAAGSTIDSPRGRGAIPRDRPRPGHG